MFGNKKKKKESRQFYSRRMSGAAAGLCVETISSTQGKEKSIRIYNNKNAQGVEVAFKFPLRWVMATVLRY